MNRRKAIQTGIATLLSLALGPALASSARADLVAPTPPRVSITLAGDGRVSTPIPQSLEVRITNQEARPLEVRVERLVLVDPSGMRLPLRIASVSHAGGAGRDLSLAPNQVANVTITFTEFPERQARSLSAWDIEVSLSVQREAAVRGVVRLTRAR